MSMRDGMVGKWLIDWEWYDECAHATVYEVQKSDWRYEVARIENVPAQEDDLGDGEMCLIREGKEADRLRDVSMIVRAPDMLQTLREAAAALEAVTGLGKPDAECGTWIAGKGSATEEVWRELVEIQVAIERQIEEVENLETR